MAASSSYDYGTLRFLVDVERDIDIPAGVLLWNAETGELYHRIPNPTDRIPHLHVPVVAQYLETTIRNIRALAESGRLPYSDRSQVKPLTAEWWEYLGRTMRHSVRLHRGGTVHCIDASQSIEQLYETLVKPIVASQQRIERISSELKEALAGLEEHFEYNRALPAFNDYPLRVSRHFRGPFGIVVVEAVNLAVQSAEDDALELVGRLRMLREGAAQNYVYLVGYLASPGGLNGETPLRDFIARDVRCEVFDLHEQRDQFRRSARTLLDQVGADPVLSV